MCGNRRGGEGHTWNIGLQWLEAFLVSHAKTLLFNRLMIRPSRFEIRWNLASKGMVPMTNVDFAAGQGLPWFFWLCGPNQTDSPPEFNREGRKTLFEIVEIADGEQGSSVRLWRPASGHCSGKSGAHTRPLSCQKPTSTTDQTVHRPCRKPCRRALPRSSLLLIIRFP